MRKDLALLYNNASILLSLIVLHLALLPLAESRYRRKDNETRKVDHETFLMGAKENLPPKKMAAVIQAAARDKYWPDLSCVPHAWYPDPRTKLNASLPVLQLLKNGVIGLYKLEVITTKCEGMLNGTADYSSVFKEADEDWEHCLKSCILTELGIFDSNWTQPATLGDWTFAVNNFKELLTSIIRRSPTQSAKVPPLSEDLVAEIIVLNMFNAFKQYKKTSPGPVTCFEGVKFETLLNGMELYVHVQEVGEFANVNDAGCPTEFPRKMWPPADTKNVTVMSIIKGTISIWPDTLCLKQYSSGISKLEKLNEKGLFGELVDVHVNCRTPYNLKHFKKEYGGEHAVDSCTKLCILQHLGVLSVLDQSAGFYLSKIGPSSFSSSSSQPRSNNRNVSVSERLSLFYGWEPTQIIRDDEDGNMKHNNKYSAEAKEITKRFVAMVDKSLKAHNLTFENQSENGGGGAECFDVKRWSPFLADVESHFENECKGGPRRK